ncbi:MAG: energy-coupling factor ABC transporter ATP-binding protein [Ruminococcus sp.]|uniref:ABC transporter ATP-binding protein n=1 Tax=Ruminococcus sp. TaxID=41978 RepID=UPI0025E95CEB|nr:energy-coupling factor ABC transporter ATP-binding protein [Ruminococcus sp.]MCR5600960.1 energy-coupling factor ABC transporter ATP-binding protein [Ruminococcus sp.]
MIEFKDLSFSYSSGNVNKNDETDTNNGSLRNIDLTVRDGEFVLLTGSSGCGKTTLIRFINGLIPNFFSGDIKGEVLLDGKNISEMSLFDLSSRVGSVFQNPRSQFFNVDTTSELAFGCENHGIEVSEIKKRVNEVSEKLAIKKLMGRNIFAMSGGEKQKIACGSVVAVQPDIYVLDEPSSNLDVYAADELRKFLVMLKSAGKTVVIVEHRLYYLADLADRVIVMNEGTIKYDSTMENFRKLSENERAGMGLRALSLTDAADVYKKTVNKEACDSWHINDLRFRFKGENEDVLNIKDESISSGRITAVIGHNGAGKTTFSRVLCGLEKRAKGTIEKDGKAYNSKQRLKKCYMIMQDVNHQLFTESVLDEIFISMEEKNEDEAMDLLRQMDLEKYSSAHPMSLSGGQKQRASIASAMAAKRDIFIFDEPTSGLDLYHMKQVAAALGALADSGKTVVVVTHDVEFVLMCCDEVVHLEEGNITEHYALDSDESRKHLLDFFNV